MLTRVPVSRKRKKKPSRSGRPSTRPGGSPRHPGVAAAASASDSRELAQAFKNLVAHRDQVETRRVSRAATMATELVADVATAAVDQPDVVVTDVVCARLGALLAEDERSPVDVRVGPDHLAEAALAEVETTLVTALSTTGQADAWHGPWRALTALSTVLPHPYPDAVQETILRLRALPAGRVLPRTPCDPEMTGAALWTVDCYGSRFAVAAPIATAGEGERWYLWDIDVCGFETFTVHSGYYPSADAALTSWQAGVGEVAAAGTVLTPVDDPDLVAALLPLEVGFMRLGGENAEQLAEYHRSRRLAQVVKQALPRSGTRSGTGLTAAAAAAEFAAWVRRHERPESPESPENLEELIEELADSWNLNSIDALYPTCSPHRVALCVLHLRNYYLADVAGQLVALLPDWTAWLAERNDTPPELSERCLPYAQGLPHPQLGDDDCKVDHLARVME